MNQIHRKLHVYKYMKQFDIKRKKKKSSNMKIIYSYFINTKQCNEYYILIVFIFFIELNILKRYWSIVWKLLNVIHEHKSEEIDKYSNDRNELINLLEYGIGLNWNLSFCGYENVIVNRFNGGRLVQRVVIRQSNQLHAISTVDLTLNSIVSSCNGNW